MEFLFSISYMGCHPKPIDELIFFRGVGQPPTSVDSYKTMVNDIIGYIYPCKSIIIF